MILKVVGGPSQNPPAFVNVGVTLILPVIGALVALVATKAAISFVLLAAKLMAVFEFVQLKSVFGTKLVKSIAVVLVLLQTTCDPTALTFGIGLIVIGKVIWVPIHVNCALVAFGVTEIVPTIGVVPVLFAVNEDIFPMPVADKPEPILTFELFHSKMVFVAPNELWKFTAGTVVP